MHTSFVGHTSEWERGGYGDCGLARDQDSHQDSSCCLHAGSCFWSCCSALVLHTERNTGPAHPYTHMYDAPNSSWFLPVCCALMHHEHPDSRPPVTHTHTTVAGPRPSLLPRRLPDSLFVCRRIIRSGRSKQRLRRQIENEKRQIWEMRVDKSEDERNCSCWIRESGSGCWVRGSGECKRVNAA